MTIDFHSHILPLADHGSSSAEMSLAQLAKARKAGIDVAVATPHFTHADSVKGFLKRRDSSYAVLAGALEENPIPIKIIKGAEVSIFVDIENLESLELLCIENTNCILLEMPYTGWTDWVYRTIYNISSQRGLQPVIAHVDRYPQKSVLRLLDMSVTAQVNASALSSFFGRFCFTNLLNQKKLHLLGSDAHQEAREYKDFAKALKLLGPVGTAMMNNAAYMLHI